MMMEAVRTSETSVDNYFTRQYIPEDNYEHHTRRRENLKSHKILLGFPNVEAILRLILSLIAKNCLGERSFSRLKHAKNKLRVVVMQQKLRFCPFHVH
jgi:hypothetical protein